MFNIPADIVYMRFYKKGEILRVARARGGLCAALYPTYKKEIFETEAFQEVEDYCPKGKINRSEISDKIWLRLLDKEPTKKILKDYKEFAGYHIDLPAEDNSFEYRYPTFRIAEDRTETE